jgi:hypothetical protein
MVPWQRDRDADRSARLLSGLCDTPGPSRGRHSTGDTLDRMLEWSARRRLLVTCVLLVCVAAAPLISPVASRAQHAAARPSASTQGAALLRRIEQAYTEVPGVIVRSSFGRFTEVLSHAKVVSESFSATDSDGTTRLVAINGSPTYAEEAGTGCWRALARSASQTLDGTGHRLLYGFGTKVTRTQSTATGWTVTLISDGSTDLVTVNKALLVQAVTLKKGKQRLEETFTTLLRAPALPKPKPRCS